MVNIESEWHVIYTRPGCESKVAASLRKKEIEHYCPFIEVQSKVGKVMKTCTEPLFTSHLFVKILKSQFSDLRQTKDVINFLYWLNKPVMIRDCDIEAIKQFLNERINVRVEKIPITPDANKVIIIEQMVASGSNITRTLNKTRRLTLPALGYAMISGEYRKVEEIEVFNKKQTARKIIDAGAI